MSIKAVQEFVVYFDTFRNIDLSQQGVYCIRTRISQEGSGVSAVPYNFSVLASTSTDELHKVLEPSLSDGCAVSKGFFVRYFEEVIEIKEQLCFRAEVDFSLNKEPSGFKLLVELLFSSSGVTHSEAEGFTVIKEEIKFEVMTTAEYDINFIYGMECGFIPISFYSQHAILNCTVHYLLENYLFTEAHSDVAEALFSKAGELKKYIGATETDRVYNGYAGFLVDSYEKLRKYFSVLLNQCLSYDKRHALGLLKTPLLLQLPGKQFQVPYKTTAKSTVKQLSCSMPNIDKFFHGTHFNFSKRVASHDPVTITRTMLHDLEFISAQLVTLWKRFGEVLGLVSKSVRFLLQDKYKSHWRTQFSSALLSHVFTVCSLHIQPSAARESLKSRAKTLRLQNSNSVPSALPITDPTLQLNPLFQPVILEEIAVLSQLQGKQERVSSEYLLSAGFRPCRPRVCHLFVLVHGFHGSPSDMKVIKNNISASNPSSYFLLSAVNEEDTDSSIESLGVKLAEEVTAYLRDFFPDVAPNKLSFIGHSLGGLIVRAALPYLSNYSEKMFLLMTVSTPHLGISKSSSKLVKAGVWILNKIKRAASLKQLALCDKEGFLYKLSEFEGIDWFQYLVVLSSPQDLYVPGYSARIEVAQVEGRDLRHRMASNLLAKRQVLYRLSVDFCITDRFIDSFIGRAAHIQFLEDDVFMKTLLFTHPEFFC